MRSATDILCSHVVKAEAAKQCSGALASVRI